MATSAKTLGRFKVPKKIRRSSRRKFTRMIYRLTALFKGFFLGVFTVVVLWLASISNSYAQATNANCGGTSQPRCEVNVSVDAETQTANTTAQGQITSGVSSLKGSLNNIPDNKFSWTFIPQIPTAACANPRVQSPLTQAQVEMDICGSFNKFSVFINGVLAVFCIFGCVRQVQAALKA